jgi:molecular chaperone DnaK (HSP70)
MVNLIKHRQQIDPENNSLIELDNNKINELLAKNTYVGIDFGTSTTVVSMVTKDVNEKIYSKTLELEQPDKYGGKLSHHLVNSVLAWYRGNLLFGADAYSLRQELFEGKNIFSSFKMRLGIDIGPTYPETDLKKSAGYNITIENANDATRLFFKCLHESIVNALKIKNYSNNIHYAVSVPASFEANQRADLVQDIKNAGIPIAESCLIDEPNAAFLSYINEAATGSNQNNILLDRLREGESSHLIVYDFGAGTCDVSILEIKISENHQVISKNLAISRFTLLGGNNIDNDIARVILLPQLLESAPGFNEFTARDLEERIIPLLQPTAEELKIQSIEWLNERKIDSLDKIKELPNLMFVSRSIPKFKLKKVEFQLEKPTLYLHDLIKVFKPYIGTYNSIVNKSHIYAPIEDAIEKTQLKPEDIQAVLFIGGSSSNLLVQKAIIDLLPKSVVPIIPKDLRSHVSLGAAIHSYVYHAYGFDIIKPITSEPISLITLGHQLEIIVPASTEVPSVKPFITKCKITRKGQKIVQLPICVNNINKIIGIIEIESDKPNGYNENEEIIIQASITHDKLLKIDAKISDQKINSYFLNPLANKELTQTEKLMLKAKQNFNIALLKYGSNIPKRYVLEYAQTAEEAGAHEIAADMYQTIERLEPDQDRSTSICYNYSMAGQTVKSDKWAKIAYKRNPNYINCWNLSLRYYQKDLKEKLLRECLSDYPGYLPALYSLGMLLFNNDSDKEGKIYLDDYKDRTIIKLRNKTINYFEKNHLIKICELFNYYELLEEVKKAPVLPVDDSKNDPLYRPENLVKPTTKPRLTE